MCGADCAPSTLITAPCSCAILAIVLTSLIVPKTLETCAIATILVLSLMVAFISSNCNSPSFVIGINFSVAFLRLANCCHGTILA